MKQKTQKTVMSFDNDVVKTAWADAGVNKEFIYVKTYSGYRSGRADPQGVEHFFSPDAADKQPGPAVLDALVHSTVCASRAAKGCLDSS